MENQENELKARKETFFKEFVELQKKHKFSLDIKLDFPEYKILPVDVQLALAVISKHKTSFVLDCLENDDKK
jgi:hypothetical protein